MTYIGQLLALRSQAQENMKKAEFRFNHFDALRKYEQREWWRQEYIECQKLLARITSSLEHAGWSE